MVFQIAYSILRPPSVILLYKPYETGNPRGKPEARPIPVCHYSAETRSHLQTPRIDRLVLARPADKKQNCFTIQISGGRKASGAMPRLQSAFQHKIAGSCHGGSYPRNPYFSASPLVRKILVWGVIIFIRGVVGPVARLDVPPLLRRDEGAGLRLLLGGGLDCRGPFQHGSGFFLGPLGHLGWTRLIILSTAMLRRNVFDLRHGHQWLCSG